MASDPTPADPSPADLLAEAVEALEPFAAVAEHDIGGDEGDNDLFRPMSSHNRAPRLTIGDLRRARATLTRIKESRNG